MKKIVPFNNVLDFDTDVCEITAISLEHNIKTDNDLISGEFYIMGEYKITDGQLEKEKFDFVLPFDIALGTNYDRSTLVIDIDDFRYEIIDRNKLKVAIDLYIDGEVLPDEVTMDREETEVIEDDDIENEIDLLEEDDISSEEEVYGEVIEEESNEEEIEQVLITERIDLLDEMLDKDKKENGMDNTNININNNDNTDKIDIFNNSSEDKYVTYRVYRVMDNDTIDKIMEKYEITKEELSKYNDLDMIKPGDKLIIPSISK